MFSTQNRSYIPDTKVEKYYHSLRTHPRPTKKRTTNDISKILIKNWSYLRDRTPLKQRKFFKSILENPRKTKQRKTNKSLRYLSKTGGIFGVGGLSLRYFSKTRVILGVLSLGNFRKSCNETCKMTIPRERRIAETRHYTRWKALSIPRFLICNTYKSAGKHRRYLKKNDFFQLIFERTLLEKNL